MKSKIAKTAKWLSKYRSWSEQTVKDTIKASIRLVVLFGILVKTTEFKTHFVQSHIFQFSRKIQNQTSQVCLWNVLYVILASSTCNACEKINKRSSSSPDLQIRIFLWQDQEHGNNIPVTESNAYDSDSVLQLFLTWATYQHFEVKTRQYVVISANTS